MTQGWFLAAASGGMFWIGLELVLLGLILATISHLLGSRSVALVHTWAAHGGWDVVRCRRCFFYAGGQLVLPGLPVFRVTLRSRSGRERVALVRVGNMMLGALSDELDVEWVETAGR